MTPQAIVTYLGVSGICLLLNNAVLILADAAGFMLLVSVVLSYSVVVVTGYLLHSRVTFRQPLGTMAFTRYSLAMAANIPLLFTATWLWRNFVGLPMSEAAPLATGCMVIVNFALGRWAISGSKPLAP